MIVKKSEYFNTALYLSLSNFFPTLALTIFTPTQTHHHFTSLHSVLIQSRSALSTMANSIAKEKADKVPRGQDIDGFCLVTYLSHKEIESVTCRYVALQLSFRSVSFSYLFRTELTQFFYFQFDKSPQFFVKFSLHSSSSSVLMMQQLAFTSLILIMKLLLMMICLHLLSMMMITLLLIASLVMSDFAQILS